MNFFDIFLKQNIICFCVTCIFHISFFISNRNLFLWAIATCSVTKRNTQTSNCEKWIFLSNIDQNPVLISNFMLRGQYVLKWNMWIKNWYLLMNKSDRISESYCLFWRANDSYKLKALCLRKVLVPSLLDLSKHLHIAK